MKTLILLLLPLFSFAQNSQLTSTKFSIYQDGQWSDIKDVTSVIYLVGDTAINYEGFHFKIISWECLTRHLVQYHCVDEGKECTVRCGYKCGQKYITLVWKEPTVVIHLTGIGG